MAQSHNRQYGEAAIGYTLILSTSSKMCGEL
jgi:hypothetical protein